MTTLSKHQPGAGQGVEFQSRQSHTGTKGAGECEKLFIPLLTCSHMKTHIILWKMRNVNLGMCLKVKQCSFVKLRLPNPIRCEFVKMCYLCFTSSLYKHCFKSYPTFSMTVSRKTVGLEGYTDPTFISPALCCWSVVLKTKTWLKDHYSVWKLGLERSHKSVFEHLYQNEQKSMFYKSVPNKNLSLTLWILMRLLFNPDHSRNVTSHFSPIMATPTSNQQETKTQKQTEKHLMNNQFWSDCAGCVLRLDLTHIIRCKTSSVQHVSLSQVYVVYASGLFLYVLKEYSCMTYRLDSSNKSTSINISIRDQSSFSLQFII